MRNQLIVLGLFALFGVFLLRGGITGNVISESCCFGPECAPENQCPTSTAATLERPAFLSEEDNNALSVVGLLVTVVSMTMIFGYLWRRAKQNKKQALNNE